MHTPEQINEALTPGERLLLLLICNLEESFQPRMQFVRKVLVGRLGWQIEGWDIMDYCMLLTAVANRLQRQDGNNENIDAKNLLKD